MNDTLLEDHIKENLIQFLSSKLGNDYMEYVDLYFRVVAISDDSLSAVISYSIDNKNIWELYDNRRFKFIIYFNLQEDLKIGDYSTLNKMILQCTFMRHELNPFVEILKKDLYTMVKKIQRTEKLNSFL